MTFEQAKEKRDALESVIAKTEAVMREFPTGPMGLTPDWVRADPTWKVRKRAFDFLVRQLQQHNIFMVKTFKAELAAERQEKRNKFLTNHES